MTSSKISSAPTRSHSARRPSKKPGPGATRFMFAATGSTRTAATESSSVGTSLYGATIGVLDRARRDARRSGKAHLGDTAAAGDEQRVGVTVVAAVELHDLVALREAARESDGAHDGFGARGDESHLLETRGLARSWLQRAAPRRASGRRRSCPSPTASRMARRRWGGRGRAATRRRTGRSRGTCAVDVGDVGALAARDGIGQTTNGAKRAHRGVDPPGMTAWARSNQASFSLNDPAPRRVHARSR